MVAAEVEFPNLVSGADFGPVLERDDRAVVGD
jgi:hypothetical protein